jgi:hypothetical protein
MWWLLLLGLGSALASGAKAPVASALPPEDPTKAHNGPIVLAIIITIGFCAIWTTLYITSQQDSSWSAVWVMPVCWLLHVILGRLITAIVEGLCNAIDSIYGLQPQSRWGGWAVDSRLVFASLWPLSGAIMLPVSFIGVLFGLLFKGLF